ncbi:teicoplanin resistance protein VanZ [Halobacteriales archaeon QS_1_68_17]|nr:MAG: teicoplanin resistance protein VanZ [Halobacteriales archaeon QS_1_68_17]
MQGRRLARDWFGVSVWTVVLLVASLLPFPFGRHPGWGWFAPDKLLHLIGHAVHAAMLVRRLENGPWTDESAALLAVCLSTGHGLATGWLQQRIPGRASEPADVLAGLLGAVLAVTGWYHRRRSRPDPVP